MNTRIPSVESRIHLGGCEEEYKTAYTCADHHCAAFDCESYTPVTLNNVGAQLILDGRYAEAVQCLGRALKRSKEMIDGRRRRQQKGQAETETLLTDKRSSASLGDERRTGTPRSRPHHHSVGDTADNQAPQEIDGAITYTPRIPVPRGIMAPVPRTRPQSQRLPRHTNPKSCCSNTTKCPRSRTTSQDLEAAFDASGPNFVYSDPVILDTESHICSRHRTCMMRLAVVIIFNMALSHHLLGRSMITLVNDSRADHSPERTLEWKRIGMAELKRAVALYSLSCRIQVRERVVVDEILSMAHLNNLGWIHATFGNTQTCTAIFERLLSNLVLYTEFSRCRPNRLLRMTRRLSGFHKNTVQVIFGKSVVASAA